MNREPKERREFVKDPRKVSMTPEQCRRTLEACRQAWRDLKPDASPKEREILKSMGEEFARLVAAGQGFYQK